MFDETNKLDRRFDEEESGTVTLSLPSYDEMCKDYFAYDTLLRGVLNSFEYCSYNELGVTINEKKLCPVLMALAPLAFENRAKRVKQEAQKDA